MISRFIKSIFLFIVAAVAMPMTAQDAMNVYFKDGTNRQFYLKNISEISTNSIDANGVNNSGAIFQHITADYHDFVYDIADVDSITFTKFNEEKTIENLTSTLATVLPAISNCNSAEEANQHLNEIMLSEGVEDAWCDDFNLYVKIKDWVTIHFNFDPKPFEVDASIASARMVNQTRAMLPKLAAIVKPDGTKLKAVIANQQHYDEKQIRQNNVKSYYALRDDMQQLDIDTEYLEEPGVEFFLKDIYKYDIIILSTHGEYESGLKKHSLYTGDVFHVINKKTQAVEPSKDFLKDKAVEIVKKCIKEKDLDAYYSITYCDEIRNGDPTWVGYISINEDIFGEIAGDAKFNSNSIFFNAACRSLMSNKSLAEKLIKRGLNLYFGYDEYNSEGQNASCLFLGDLLKGKSVIKSYSDLWDVLLDKKGKDGDFIHIASGNLQKEHHEYGKSEWDVNLKMVPENDAEMKQMFLFPVYTEQVTETDFKSENAESSLGTLKGYTTLGSIENSPLTFGFEVGLTETKLQNDVKSTDIKNVSSEHGNVVFQATASGFEPGATYHYRAYTYDGMSYNYGEVKTVKIPEYVNELEQLSEMWKGRIADLMYKYDELLKKLQEKATKEQAKELYERMEYVKQYIDDMPNLLRDLKFDDLQKPYEDVTQQLKDLANDIENFTVSDQSGESYLSCPDDKHPHMIDLGLPSGTKWACCNVGAQKPEDNGGYYTYGQFFAPTKEQFEELLNNCSYTWTTQNGVNGGKFVGTNGGAIFIPASGCRWEGELDAVGFVGDYWTSSLVDNDPNVSWSLFFNRNDFYVTDENFQELGYSVRQVYVTPSTTSFTVTTNAAKDIIDTSVTLSGTVTGNNATARYTAGFLLSTEGDPSDSNYTLDVTYASSSPSGVFVIPVTGLTCATKYFFRAYVLYNGKYYYGPVGDFTTSKTLGLLSCPDNNHPHMIDLGLPSGTKWACCNEGANAPEEFGGYYSYGQISSAPSIDQIKELLNNCSYAWSSTKNGINGGEFTGPNGCTIFLPAAGYRFNGEMYSVGTFGEYWSSSPYINNYNHSDVCDLIFCPNYAVWSFNSQSANRSVRPVQ